MLFTKLDAICLPAHAIYRPVSEEYSRLRLFSVALCIIAFLATVSLLAVSVLVAIHNSLLGLFLDHSVFVYWTSFMQFTMKFLQDCGKVNIFANRGARILFFL